MNSNSGIIITKMNYLSRNDITLKMVSLWFFLEHACIFKKVWMCLHYSYMRMTLALILKEPFCTRQQSRSNKLCWLLIAMLYVLSNIVNSMRHEMTYNSTLLYK